MPALSTVSPVPRLLLIEDDAAIRTSLTRSLSERGHAVASAPTAMAGLQAVVDTAPDLVVLDLGLPDLDGGKELLGNDLATGLSEQVGGFIAIPDAPGIGVELVPDVERKFPYRPRPISMRPHVDGSMVDQ